VPENEKVYFPKEICPPDAQLELHIFFFFQRIFRLQTNDLCRPEVRPLARAARGEPDGKVYLPSLAPFHVLAADENAHMIFRCAVRYRSTGFLHARERRESHTLACPRTRETSREGGGGHFPRIFVPSYVCLRARRGRGDIDTTRRRDSVTISSSEASVTPIGAGRKRESREDRGVLEGEGKFQVGR